MKKVLSISSILIAVLSLILSSYAGGMTAFDYATISAEEWASIDARNKDESEAAKQKQNYQNQQKAKDKYSGPAALESTGTLVIGEDTTQYFPEETTVAVSADEVVTLAIPESNFIFTSKKVVPTTKNSFIINDVKKSTSTWKGVEYPAIEIIMSKSDTKNYDRVVLVGIDANNTIVNYAMSHETTIEENGINKVVNKIVLTVRDGIVLGALMDLDVFNKQELDIGKKIS